MRVSEHRGHENGSKHKQQLHTQRPFTSLKPFSTHDAFLRVFFIFRHNQCMSFGLNDGRGYPQGPTYLPGSVLFWGSLPVV